jgi:hypothetical protein
MIAKESPLKGMNIGTVATVAIREIPGLHTIDLRVAPGTSSQTAIANALGIDLPLRSGQSNSSISGKGDVHVLCLAPDWWLIAGLNDAAQKLLSLQQPDQYHYSAVDVSGQRTTIVCSSLGTGSPGKKFSFRKCFPGTDGEGAGDRLPYGAVSLPCHGQKFFRFALVEGVGRRGGGVGVSRDVSSGVFGCELF